MTHTTNYYLKKPDTSDPVDIADLNDNFDEIDTQLKNNFDLATSKQDKVAGKGLSTNDYTDADAAKVAALGNLSTKAVNTIAPEDTYTLELGNGVFLAALSSQADSTNAGLYIITGAQVAAVLSSSVATVTVSNDNLSIVNSSITDTIAVTVLRIS